MRTFGPLGLFVRSNPAERIVDVPPSTLFGISLRVFRLMFLCVTTGIVVAYGPWSGGGDLIFFFQSAKLSFQSTATSF